MAVNARGLLCARMHLHKSVPYILSTDQLIMLDTSRSRKTARAVSHLAAPRPRVYVGWATALGPRPRDPLPDQRRHVPPLPLAIHHTHACTRSLMPISSGRAEPQQRAITHPSRRPQRMSTLRQSPPPSRESCTSRTAVRPAPSFVLHYTPLLEDRPHPASPFASLFTSRAQS